MIFDVALGCTIASTATDALDYCFEPVFLVVGTLVVTTFPMTPTIVVACPEPIKSS